MRVALAMGGEAKLAQRRASGHPNARERIDQLRGPGSFSETGLLAVSSVPADRDFSPADAKVTGTGRIEGRRLAVVSNDMTVKGASSSTINTRKISRLKETDTHNGMPLVFLGESSGSRVQYSAGAEVMGSGGQDPQLDRRVCAAARCVGLGSDLRRRLLRRRAGRLLGAIVIDGTHPGVRATVTATMTLANNLTGLAPGLFIAGLLSDRLGLKLALALAPVLALVSAVFFVLASRSYVADVARNRARGTPQAV